MSPTFSLDRSVLHIAAAVLAGSSLAQTVLPPDADFFGEAIVKPLNYERGRGGGLLMREKPPDDAETASPRAKLLSHTLHLTTGATLRGTAGELTPDALIWHHPDFSEPVRFARSGIRKITLGKDSAPASTTSRVLLARNVAGAAEAAAPEKRIKQATLKLSNGGWLHGEVSSTEKEFLVKTASGSSLPVPRDAVKWMYFSKSAAPAFSFTGDGIFLAGWNTGGAAPEVVERDGRMEMQSASWVGRALNAPERFEVAFEIPPQDENSRTRLWLQPYSLSPNSYSTGTIELSFGGKEMERLIYTNEFKRETLKFEPEQASGPAKIRVFYDGVAGRLAVLRNGVKLGEWALNQTRKNEEGKETVIKPRPPRAICLDRGYRTEPLRLLSFSAQPWNGRLPVESASEPAAAVLSAGDAPPRHGALESVQDGVLVFSGTELETEAGMFIEFAEKAAPASKGDALLTFGAAGEITVAGFALRDGRATGQMSGVPLECDAASLGVVEFPASRMVEPSGPDLLVFRNGDALRGKLLATTGDGSLAWRTEDGHEVHVAPGHLAGVRLAASARTTLAPGAIIELRNGDRIRGKLTGLDEQVLTVESEVIGRRELPRTVVWNLIASEKMDATDAGANPHQWLAGVQPARRVALLRIGEVPDKTAPTGHRERIYLDGHYMMNRGPQTAGDSLNWSSDRAPEKFELRFTATDSSGVEPRVTLSFNGASGSPTAQISSSYGSVSYYSHGVAGNRGNVITRQRQFDFTDKLGSHSSRREYRYFVDSKKGTIEVLLDGVLLGTIGQNASERLPGVAGRVNLTGYSSGSGPLILSDIWIGPWSGELPRHAGGAVVSLANGDTANGTVGGMKNNALLIESEAGPLEVPFERVQFVHFGGEPAPTKGGTRLRLVDGSTLHVALFKFADDRLSAAESNVGALDLPAGKIAEIVLNAEPVRFPKIADPRKVAKSQPGNAEEKAE